MKTFIHLNFFDLFEGYELGEFDYRLFILNSLIVALLSGLLSMFYKKYGRAVSNRESFSNNFILLALSTMLIIYIVKSSIALSLGLVGALSIVRFRAAIKEPEELTYLFFVIGIGLGMGANQGMVTILSFVLIIAILFIQAKLKKTTANTIDKGMIINISSANLDQDKFSEIIANSFKDVDLKRINYDNGITSATYIIEANNLEQISSVKKELISLDPKINFSFIDRGNMIS